MGEYRKEGTDEPRIAGPALNAEIAERVMGCNIEWLSLSPQAWAGFCLCGKIGRYAPHSDDYSGEVLSYSTDLSAAGLVLDAMVAKGCEWVIGNEADGWEVEIIPRESARAGRLKGNYSHALMLPLAICKAALAALPDKAQLEEIETPAPLSPEDMTDG